MPLGKTPQADLIQIRQRRDHLERLAGRDIEVVGGLVADDDVDLHPALQGPVDLPGHRQRQVEIRGADGQLALGAGNQLADHPVQRVALAHPEQRADRQPALVQATGSGVVGGVLEAAAQIADVVAQAAGGGQVRQVQAVHCPRLHQAVLYQVVHGVGQRLVVQQVVTVEAVLVELVQVHVVQAGAAVEHAVVDDETLEVQHPEQLAGLNRHAVDRHFAGVSAGHLLVPGRVARLLAGTDQAALGPQPVNHDHHFQLGAGGLGGVQGIEDFLAGFILLQVQRDDIDAPACLGNLLQQRAAKLRSAGQRGESLGGQWEAAQLGQQGTFEKRRH